MYARFSAWCEQQGHTFPCTADQFYSRAVHFANTLTTHDHKDPVDYLCTIGIGPNWRD